ncbi:Reverse transcriptase (RNA-dependent DNA polymerase) [Trypanosoma brucei equiperdum]|uniref:Reverse transcriptase (RNA-dependent DNA polymerase) n=1 Tax=Trypanosoma brucei equiperdum TaxID=630700 RepID=A0A3L6KWR5_9TRYP|nr:Reverse transcriptase (RNA-dependent DNA polymerase) [Trypanosoma brucei equiperdum]
MERIIAARLRDTVESQLTPQQSGFHPGCSTLEQLLHIRAALFRPTHQYRTGAVFVDYSKAFDTVDHDKIAREMHRMKVLPHIVKWCVSFLSNRTGRVRFKEKLSRSRTFERGVPQGTVRGPIMFIIVMNSLSQRLAEVPLLQHGFFADDPDATFEAHREGCHQPHATMRPQRGVTVVKRVLHVCQRSENKVHTLRVSRAPPPYITTGRRKNRS